jgi:hypothetical protein
MSPILAFLSYLALFIVFIIKMSNKKTTTKLYGRTLKLTQNIQGEMTFIPKNYTYKRIYKFISLTLIGLLMLLILLPNYISITEAQRPTVKVKWVIHSNPTKYDESAHSVCEAGDYIYIIGDQAIGAMWYVRIEMRLKSDGSLVKVWASEDYTLHDCVIVNDKLYVTGDSFDILVFDLDLNLLTYKKRDIPGKAMSSVFYKNYLYIAGWEDVGWYGLLVDRGWRVEKWKIEELTLVKEYTINPTEVWWDMALTVGVNPVTEQVWVVGYDEDGFRIDILDLDLNLIKVVRSFLWNKSYNIDFDEDGNAYICGWMFVAKFDKEGNEVVTRSNSHNGCRLLYANGLIYVGTTEGVISSDKHILFIYDKNLTQLNMITLGHYWFSRASFIHGKAAFDGKNLYIAGYDARPGDYEWTIYSISLTSTEDSAISLIWWIVIIIAATATLSLVFLWIKRKHKRIRIKTKPKIPPPPI